MIEVFGKGSIARILKDSISPQGNRLTTMEIEVPRIVWCEFLTHGMLARNAHSSRAIPFDKMVEQLTGKPVRFGQANRGMQDKGEEFDAPVYIPGHLYVAYGEFIKGYWSDDFMNTGVLKVNAQQAWDFHKFLSTDISRAFYNAGYAKQVFNRVTEAHQMIKAVVSATEWDNYYWLRDDVAADPTLHDLASTMRKAHEQSVPQLLHSGEWHLPYVEDFREQIGFEEDNDTPIWGPLRYHIGSIFDDSYQELTLEEAIKVSSARTGAVSFRNTDYDLERSLSVYDKLVGDERKHASAMQHQATPMQQTSWGSDLYEYGAAGAVNQSQEPSTWEPGISHADRDGNLWSAQFKGFIMNRKLIPGENYTKPK